MGREGKLTAGVVYNVFDAAFRASRAATPAVPYYFVIDEAQKISWVCA
jgi:hypothetical protein